MIFHMSRLLYFSDKADIANYGYLSVLSFGFVMFAILFVCCRKCENGFRHLKAFLFT